MTQMANAQLVHLADIIVRAPEDQEPAPDFVANLHGENVEVTAVLERTAVVAPLRDRWADKQLVLHADLLVDPAVVRWRPKEVLAWRRRRNAEGQREAQRAASDRRARADQARQAAETAARRRTASTGRPDGGRAMLRTQTAAASQCPMTVSLAATPVPAATKTAPATDWLASELRRAQHRIAKLEAELEHHRTVARDVQRRVELAAGRRAAA